MEIFSSSRSEGPIVYKNEYKKYDDVSYETAIVLDDKKPLDQGLIPSKDVRKYLDETGYQMTDFVKAHLIVHSDIISLRRKIDELRKLAESCSDDKLKQEIMNYADFYTYSLKSFAYNKDGEYIFRLRVSWDEKYSDYIDAVCFLNFDDAMEYIKNCDGIKYRIEKEKPLREYEDVEECCRCYGIMIIDNIVGLNYCSAYDVPDPEYDTDSFADAFVPIPFPFKNGDIVYNLKSNRMGVINSSDDGWIVNFSEASDSDYSDYNNLVIMDMLSMDDSADRNWDFDHVNPLYLEFAQTEDDRKAPFDYKTEKDVLLVLSQLIKKQASIFVLEYAVNNYRDYMKYKERESYYNHNYDNNE